VGPASEGDRGGGCGHRRARHPRRHALRLQLDPEPGVPGEPARRGHDLLAWLDKYLKGDCTADRRLLTDRWRHDGDEAAIDRPRHDGNLFGFSSFLPIDRSPDGATTDFGACP
jgi:hypothetical protein